MNRLEVLKKARRLISNPARWTKGVAARKNNGDSVASNDPSACRWCAIGACAKICQGNEDLFFRVANLLDRMAGKSVSNVNDDQGRKAVLKVFDRAIRRIETGG